MELHVNSWFFSIDYLKNKIGLDFNICKKMKHPKFKTELKKDQRRKFLSHWHKLRDNYRDSGKMTTYFDIKDSLKMEESLNIKIFQYRQIVCKFRISAHNLHIETGIYEKERNESGQNIKLDRSRRLSVVYSDSVEDEFHFYSSVLYII